MGAIFSRRRRPRDLEAWSAAAVVLFPLLISCSQPRDPVHGALDDLAAAASRRDAEPFLRHLSPDFQVADGSRRSDAEATIRRLFAGYEKLDVTLRDVQIEMSEGAAIARFRADLSGKPRAVGGLEGILPRTSSYRFELRLVPSGDRWLVAWASWSDTG